MDKTGKILISGPQENPSVPNVVPMLIHELATGIVATVGGLLGSAGIVDLSFR